VQCWRPFRVATGFVVAIFTLSAAASDSLYFDSAGVRLHYFAAGSGDTVVLLHGFGGSAQGLYLEPGTFAALVDAGYRVIALDQRGHGDSEKPHDPASYGLEMVEDVRRLLDHLQVEQVHLVGYSMGARVASAFRSRYPERLRSVALCGYGWPWSSGPRSLEQAREDLTRRPVLPGNDLDALAAVSAAGAALDVSEQSLQDNTVPAFAVIGDRDEVVPSEDQRRFATTMANLTMVVIPGTHAGPDGAPYKPIFATELIGFLTAH